MNKRSAPPASLPQPGDNDPARPQASPDNALVRRRSLLRAAIAGAPMMLGVSPAGAFAARGSAYRAAENDALASGSASGYGTGDTWTRTSVEFGRIVQYRGTSTTSAYDVLFANVYKIGTIDPRYYQSVSTSSTIAGTEVPAPSPFASKPQAFLKDEDRSVLVLFDNQSFTEAGLWPQAAVGDGIQALHCSSWSSINPAAGTAYSCTGG